MWDRIAEWIVGYGGQAVGAVATLVIGYLVARLARRWVRRGLERTGMAIALQRFVTQITYVGIFVFAILASLARFGIQTTSVVAILGAAGFAIGFALQGSLSNFAAGVLLLVLRPFKIGDFVEAGGVPGTVQDIQLFTTVLATPDNVKVMVPNAQIYGGVIRNYNGYDTRRIDLAVGIGYGGSIDEAFSAARTAMSDDDRILRNPEPQVMVDELADSSVNLNLRMWVRGGDYWPVRFDLTRRIKETFDARGIEIPYPQRVVHTK
ncbi:mechanosensitive ion channel [Candidatus Bipolaricaulota bacterium]|nr:mechanosensitive ion channel [Candidatus Bipolaricaulota bacterium]